MYLEIWFITALFATAVLAVVLPPHRKPTPTVARHSRDRYSVAAIRARIADENAATITSKPPKSPPRQKTLR